VDIRRTAGIVSFIAGVMVLFLGGMPVAAVIGGAQSVNPLGFLLVLAGAILVVAAHAPAPASKPRIVLRSSIHNSPSLCRLAEEATNNERVQTELNHLLSELSRGNDTAGLTPGRIGGTDVSYLRGRNGGRLFYRSYQARDERVYDVVGKSCKGRNEDQVISAIEKIYRH
jgi:hypothetical protein